VLVLVSASSVGNWQIHWALQRVGDVYEESLILLSVYARDGDWKVVKEKAIRENLLKKGSSRWTENIQRAVKRRFFADHPPLPSERQISKFVRWPKALAIPYVGFRGVGRTKAPSTTSYYAVEQI